ncbi:MAG: hypothetical protein ACE5K9_03120 [Candidatus Methylomirabilales bacterium]
MILLEEVSFDVVVACWLRAELSSPRFRPRLVKALKHLRASPRVIEKPRLTSPRENFLRQRTLALYRGDILRTFPSDTRWWRATITFQEFRRLWVINYPTWTFLSRNSGRLSTVAHVIAGETVSAQGRGRLAQEVHAVITNVHEIRDRLKVPKILKHQLILMGRPKGRTWTIIEGNKRGTGLYIRCVLAKAEPFPPCLHVLVGLTAKPFPWLRVS